jgi:hypothetical protein
LAGMQPMRLLHVRQNKYYDLCWCRTRTVDYTPTRLTKVGRDFVRTVSNFINQLSSNRKYARALQQERYSCCHVIETS